MRVYSLLLQRVVALRLHLPLCIMVDVDSISDDDMLSPLINARAIPIGRWNLDGAED